MSVFLPIAGLSINLFLLIGAGALIGFLSGLLGVGGGFLLTPILMSIGIAPTVAAASDSCQIVAASSSGLAGHVRLGNVDFRMGGILLLGGLVGGSLGVELIKVLRSLGNVDLAITITYVVMLGGTGSYMLIESLRGLRRGSVVVPKRHRAPKKGTLLARLPFKMEFPRSHVEHSILVPFLFCVIIGILTSIMGVGGGFILVPVMVYLLWMPPHVAIGTSLFQILFTCAWVTYMQAVTNQTVDLMLAVLLAAGSTVGAQVGVRVSRVMRGAQLMILLAVLALGMMLKMAIGMVIAPRVLLSAVSGH
ncbi:MAG: sulfite exporter TauE/SafE family protein [Acidobacteria bacterium]|nr:sulfite exporter TauE/SafE family protein [Acidobacteriota bacterium]